MVLTEGPAWTTHKFHAAQVKSPLVPTTNDEDRHQNLHIFLCYIHYKLPLHLLVCKRNKQILPLLILLQMTIDFISVVVPVLLQQVKLVRMI